MLQLAENTVVAERFKLNRLLGRGGMGSVWHATHLGLEIPCAVKFIEGEIARLAEAQMRFEREARSAARLRSPHVVQILDHGVCDGTPYIAMELLDGEDLGKRFQRLGRMSPNETATVITQVCRALTKAHQLGIVHRDLKPDNIFLVRDDDREIAKVLDFGIAKDSATGQMDSGSNTKTGAMLGTPYYMSPEQAQGIKTVDFRSDLWSLAVIVYQALTGKLPFESEALGDLLVKIIVAPVPVPSEVAPDLPQGFDKWFARAAARDPAQRFQTAKEFSDSLSMVCGSSFVTEITSPHRLRAAEGSGADFSQAAYGATNGLIGTPNTSTSGGAGASPSPIPASTTGAGVARTFMGGDMPDGVPKKSGAAKFVVAGALVAAAVFGVIGVKMAGDKGAAPSPVAAAGGGNAASPASPAAADAPKPGGPSPDAVIPASAKSAVAGGGTTATAANAAANTANANANAGGTADTTAAPSAVTPVVAATPQRANAGNAAAQPKRPTSTGPSAPPAARPTPPPAAAPAKPAAKPAYDPGF